MSKKKFVNVPHPVGLGFETVYLPIKGVQQHGKHWSASISENGKLRYLGMYLTREAAAVAYWKAAIEYERHRFFSNSRNRQILRNVRPDLYK